MTILKVNSEYLEYLKDESRLIGACDYICFPKTLEDIVEAISFSNEHNLPITTQGSRTGIAGGCVPNGGLLINMSQKNKILDFKRENSDLGYLRLEPGVTLEEIRKFTCENCPDLFFPPDPTEITASIGGMVNTNASGALSFKYGSTRNFTEEIKLVLSNGESLVLDRNNPKAKGSQFKLSTENNILLEGIIPSYDFHTIKNVSGYYSRYNMDMIDLFIGSEGTLGIVSELTIKLIKKPPYILAVTTFFDTENAALHFVQNFRKCTDVQITAIEYYDSASLQNLKDFMENENIFSELPTPPDGEKYAIYIELGEYKEEDLDKSLMIIVEQIEASGGNEKDTWMADNEIDIKKLKDFRHAIPESINMRIDIMKKISPGITKLGTDMAVSDNQLFDVFKIYHSILDEHTLNYLIFGHIGNNHVHVNIIPGEAAQYQIGKLSYLKIAEMIVNMGGTVSAEHGIGKLKKSLLKIMYGEYGINEMKRIKSIFDPKNILNKGNLFDYNGVR